jgi:hypothetical protein
MKTLELVDKYTKLIQGLLGCESVKFFVHQGQTVGSWVRVGETWRAEDWAENKPDEVNHWSVGSYRLEVDGVVAAAWRLYQMPHCCAICVSCNALVYPGFRGKRLGTLLNSLRKDLSTTLGYSLLLCTDIEQNTNQRKILATNGWRDIESVVNRRTGNRVYISVVNT